MTPKPTSLYHYSPQKKKRKEKKALGNSLKELEDRCVGLFKNMRFYENYARRDGSVECVP